MTHTADDTRSSWRFPTMLKGLYCLEEKKGKGKECTIINISSNGTGLEFYTDETISANSKLFLEIFPLNGEEAINVEGIIRWVKQGGKDCACGIELTEALNEATKAMLGV